MCECVLSKTREFEREKREEEREREKGFVYFVCASFGMTAAALQIEFRK